MTNSVTITVSEAVALFEAAEYVRKYRLREKDTIFPEHLTSAIRKFRRADVITIKRG
jgi:hypothetical protein